MEEVSDNNQPTDSADYGAYGPQPAVASGPSYQSTSQSQVTSNQEQVTSPQNQSMENAQMINSNPAFSTPNPNSQSLNPNNTQPTVTNQVSNVPKINPNSTQNTLNIAEVRDGIVIMNDGSFRAVAMFRAINFDLMSPGEREAVEFSYQGFLNSLFFPIQITLHSRKVDLGPYLDSLTKIRNEHDNMLLALLMDNYIQYMADMAEQVNIMDKKFYVVIPYFPHEDIQKAVVKSLNFFTGVANLFSKKEQHVVINEQDLAKAKTELRDRMELVLNGLAQCGVQGVPLDTQELIELYYDSYNPDTATRQELKNFSDLTAPIVEKGSGNAIQPNLNKEMQ